MATARSLSNPDKENFFRMSVLIVDYALKVLQDVLQKELENRYPNLFDPNTGLLCRVLGDATVRTTLFGLPSRVFNYHQRNQLYPARNPSTSITIGDLDITLTVLLLRNITSLNPRPGLNAWDNPSDADTSTEATIGKVKRYRNIVYGHANKAAISAQDFRAHFSDLKSILRSLSSKFTSEDYDSILSEPFNAASLEENQTILKEWYNYDKDMKDYLMSMQATLEESHEQIIHGLKESETKLQDHVEQVHKRSEDTILRKMDSDNQNTHNQLEEISQGITHVNVDQSEMADQLQQSQKFMEEVTNAQKEDSQNIQAQLEKGREELASLRSTQGLHLQMTKEMQENVQTICDRDRDTPEFQKIPGSVDLDIHMRISPSGMETVKSSAIFSSSQKTPSPEDTQPDREPLPSVTGGGSEEDQITGIAAHLEGEAIKNITQTESSDEAPTASSPSESAVHIPLPEDTTPLCEARDLHFMKMSETIMSRTTNFEDIEKAIGYIKEYHAMLYDTKRQCFILRLVCPSVHSLDQLWQSYHCGELQAAVEESFVNIKNLEDLGLSHSDINFWVEMEEDDYIECRKYIKENTELKAMIYEDLKMTVRKGPHGSAEQTIYGIRRALMAAFSLRKEDILIKWWDYGRPGDSAVICYGIQPHHVDHIDDNVQDLPKDVLRDLGGLTITIGTNTLKLTVTKTIPRRSRSRSRSRTLDVSNVRSSSSKRRLATGGKKPRDTTTLSSETESTATSPVNDDLLTQSIIADQNASNTDMPSATTPCTSSDSSLQETNVQQQIPSISSLGDNVYTAQAAFSGSEPVVEVPGEVTERDEGISRLTSVPLEHHVQDSVPTAQEFCLRKYQRELAGEAIKGTNTIICAPTGSGKTLTVAYICRIRRSQLLKNGQKFKAVFIVCIRNLIQQQKDAFQTIFPPQDNIVGAVSQTSDNLKSCLLYNDIVMLTAQILVNAIKEGDVKITDFNLMIMDECHHTDLDHPYNMIMRLYMTEKKNRDQIGESTECLPQIIGLSASLGTGKGSDPLQHYYRVCANLDCFTISHVRNPVNEKELLCINPKPKKDQIKLVPPRSSADPFALMVKQMMEESESEVNFPMGTFKNFDKGSQGYENWVIENRNEAEHQALHTPEMRNTVITCRFLRDLNSALMLYDDLRGKDALEFLTKKIVNDDHSIHSELPEVEKKLRKRFLSQYGRLQSHCEKESSTSNKMLEELYRLLTEQFEKNPESRGIVLIRTREGCSALERCIHENIDQRLVRVGRMTGQSGDTSMTDVQQLKVIKAFKKGLAEPDGINLLVATDVAQEGLDIPKCNLMIRYNFVSNEIGTVQSKGRARAKESECYLIVPDGSINAAREFQNMSKEHAMMEALKDFDKLDPEEVRRNIKVKQDELWGRHLQSQAQSSARRSELDDGTDVKVLCKECKTILCRGNFIIKKGSHYICVDPEFPKKIKVETVQRRDFRTDAQIGVSICRQTDTCGQSLGPVLEYKQGSRRKGYTLSKDKIMLLYPGKPGLVQVKKWPSVCFKIQEENVGD
ncbi:uncharacterized protein LOC106165417 [Lingula anatina]|uniref:RNA helicase n=1 Tax=Lingula anatina TaxID=7574 RepID=A0A1S3ING3_LINAN|nr:uncharacterized protein LOC106165417 [Lingula anatina]XP_013399074.1 uncharacterized protein LOC106165417 [Lingula anatina]|eukprot:XP_013399073.1 uncharacterized protein LOC106165417 [Lingula anatina]